MTLSMASRNCGSQLSVIRHRPYQYSIEESITITNVRRSTGNNFQHVEAWLFDERVIETLLETEQAPGKTFSQLSYAVVVVSDKYQLSVNALEAAFQQYLITKSVNAAKIKACAFQDA